MNAGPLPTRWRRMVAALARGSLSRYLIFHLLPAILLLVLLDLVATWVMTHKLATDTWLLKDFFLANGGWPDPSDWCVCMAGGAWRQRWIALSQALD